MKLSIIMALAVSTFVLATGCNCKSTQVIGVNKALELSMPSQDMVTISGVVAYVSPYDPKSFALMDIEDARNGKPSREITYLQVTSKSSTPKPGESVKVSGRFEEHVPCFTAEKVKRWKL